MKETRKERGGRERDRGIGENRSVPLQASEQGETSGLQQTLPSLHCHLSPSLRPKLHVHHFSQPWTFIYPIHARSCPLKRAVFGLTYHTPLSRRLIRRLPTTNDQLQPHAAISPSPSNVTPPSVLKNLPWRRAQPPTTPQPFCDTHQLPPTPTAVFSGEPKVGRTDGETSNPPANSIERETSAIAAFHRGQPFTGYGGGGDGGGVSEVIGRQSGTEVKKQAGERGTGDGVRTPNEMRTPNETNMPNETKTPRKRGTHPRMPTSTSTSNSGTTPRTALGMRTPEMRQRVRPGVKQHDV
ncbi:hypothetical protein CCMSSC00406_0009628 [Pleurotus cornucopiae]|uniref:Uncharacterized protein n=1 Tax=Pleurotus cornucopiae TaxID=5321 RepID=A0ACB7JAG6_PLECO|nr:hypothetical protein CCMSSC00406_0009628 [Pleurotus cornucopiae]